MFQATAPPRQQHVEVYRYPKDHIPVGSASAAGFPPTYSYKLNCVPTERQNGSELFLNSTNRSDPFFCPYPFFCPVQANQGAPWCRDWAEIENAPSTCQRSGFCWPIIHAIDSKQRFDT
jgi:hypothetical protein